ncbi:ATP-binding cassette domain-containing protein [Flavisphingomonas formosensis]|uniref:ATP-binding cassette domain-containing protein n=1 Tax=Flavisphingomonas formosensis TaxID=861534 RepID=UPI0012FA227A|nr:ATP-binding cassette domain-containing protein [Sphingomonas formosensis]
MTALDRLLGRIAAPYRATRLAATLCAAATAVSGTLLLGLAGWFIAGAAIAGVAGIAAVQGFNYLLPSAGIRLLAILRTLGRYGERLLGHRAALLVLADLRVALFEQLVRRPLGAGERTSGEAAALLIQDVQAIEDRFVRAPAQAAALCGIGAALLLTLLAGTAATIALAAILAATAAAAWTAARRWLPGPAADVQRQIAELKHELVEYAAASPEIAAYGLTASINAGLAEQAARLDAARLAFARGEARLAALGLAASGIAMAAVIALSHGSLPITLLAVLAAAGASEALGALIRSFGRDAVIAAGLARLEQLAQANDRKQAAPARPAGERLTLPGTPQVTLAAGERLAITGRSGIGKTRLVETLAGWRDTPDPALLIDGQPLDAWPPEARRSLFALSPQNAAMIGGTIADNLRLARPGLAGEALWRALEAACLAEEVRAMPDGLSTWIGDSGARLSGGQRKRLSIARALLAGRRWLLLDEPSEGLDPETEAELCRRLALWLDAEGCGLILVTHRPAMLPLAATQLQMEG